MMRQFTKENPYAIFSYTNAAILYDTPRWERTRIEIHTVQFSEKFVTRKGITHIHPHFSENEINGLRVVSIFDMLLEICVYDSTLTSISAISHHLFKKDISKTGIINYCKTKKQKSGVAKLRHFLKFASEFDESPFETKVRLALYEAELIMPMQQQNINCRNGRNYRADFLFSFNGRKVILEADGLMKYSENVEVRSEERQREADLIREGYEIMRVMHSDFNNGRFLILIEQYSIPKRRSFGRRIEKKWY